MRWDEEETKRVISILFGVTYSSSRVPLSCHINLWTRRRNATQRQTRSQERPRAIWQMFPECVRPLSNAKRIFQADRRTNVFLVYIIIILGLAVVLLLYLHGSKYLQSAIYTFDFPARPPLPPFQPCPPYDIATSRTEQNVQQGEADPWKKEKLCPSTN